MKMRLSNIPVLFLIISLFCPLYSNQIKTIGLFERKIQHSVERRDSVRFISESFRNVCTEKGFSDFDEWSETCSEMWQLDYIKWEKSEKAECDLYHGMWKGPCGEGEVYCRKKQRVKESKNGTKK